MDYSVSINSAMSQRTGFKLGKVVFRISMHFSGSVKAVSIAGDCVLKLKLNRLQLALNQIPREEWLHKELSKSVKKLLLFVV